LLIATVAAGLLAACASEGGSDAPPVTTLASTTSLSVMTVEEAASAYLEIVESRGCTVVAFQQAAAELNAGRGSLDDLKSKVMAVADDLRDLAVQLRSRQWPAEAAADVEALAAASTRESVVFRQASQASSVEDLASLLASADLTSAAAAGDTVRQRLGLPPAGELTC
jgi:hypothetical protein